MEEIDIGEGVAAMLSALLGQRLALLAGAGLSMAEPSNLPNAAQIAARAKQKYDATYGADREPLSPKIEEQAEFFFHRGELATVYLRTLIDRNVFASRPNKGHLAVADLLLVQGIQIAVTTNVDVLIERSGLDLYGNVGVALSGLEVAALPPDTSPLLKIHGCWQKDHDNTIWTAEQIAAGCCHERIVSSEECLSQRLLDKDLIILGYCTDWDYLNGVLKKVLDKVHPSKVVVVNIDDSDGFRRKAPILYDLGTSAKNGFFYVKASGEEFLDALRKAFSRTFVRLVISAGAADYEAVAGVAAPREILEPPEISNADLWSMRRDLEGCEPESPARMLSPPPREPMLGLTVLRLRASGAIADGPYWLLHDKHIRVLRAPMQLLRRVEELHGRETPPTVSPDVVIAVGADDDCLPVDFARPNSVSTVTRGTLSRWLTRQQAEKALQL